MSVLERIVLSPEQMAVATNGRWIGNIEDLQITAAALWPNAIRIGSLAVAAAPEKWKQAKGDTHLHILKMIAKGASAVMVDEAWVQAQKTLPDILLLVVDSTFVAVEQLGVASRNTSKAKRVLITGTEGKTGIKYALEHVISKQAPCYAHLSSANLTIPILFSLINIKETSEYTVVECSCPQPKRGSMRSKLVAPNMCIITNLNESHLNSHGSIAKLLQHKLEILDGLESSGTIILNKNTQLYEQFVALMNVQKPNLSSHFTFGRKEQNVDAYVEKAEFNALGWDVEASIRGKKLAYRINRVPGHFPDSSVGVLLAVDLLGLDVEQAARDFASHDLFFESMGTIQRLAINDGSFLFYDQHFSVTEIAMKSALSDVARFEVPGRKIVVISGELNSAEHAQEMHERFATYLDSTDIDILYTVGEHMEITVKAMKNVACFRGHFFDSTHLIDLLLSQIAPGDLLFIKGMTRLNFKAIADAVYQKFPEQMPLVDVAAG